ncbi:cytochrome P450 [Cohnella sp. CFH 77786]|uniref:cytochrome P450 n=1 Tax=Cohnella sp. CFH 77786 TaxID=2662265 RepID=UPI001C60A8C4|nr:cytochrome P450 [Cohnella sp. CFH 77786]MBW5446040.1 cytochrome P450 [Cohnella sp. CFH 77786]
MPQSTTLAEPKTERQRTLLGGDLKAFRRDPLAFLTELYRQGGKTAPIRLGPQKITVLFDPEMIKEVLVTKSESFIKGATFKEIARFVGDGLVISDGEKHKRHRRMLQPHFTRAHIQHYAEQMTDIASAHAELWKDGEERLLTEDLFGITFDIIARTVFTFESGEELMKIGRSYSSINRIATEKMRTLFKLPLFVPTKRNKEYLDAIKTLDEIVYTLISQRRTEKDTAHRDLLSVLMSAVDESDQSEFSDEQVRDELMTMFLAGHETTANTLSWTFHYLIQNPEAERKLREEWDRVLGERDATADDYPQLTYTQNVLWETLRLTPAGYLTGRTAAHDVIVGDHQFRKEEILFISSFPLHRSSDYFPDPLVFRPERFENEMLKTIPQFAYFPFGGGPRACIGNHYAMLEMVMVLCAIGRRFRFRLAPNHHEIVPEALLTLRPKGGIRVIANKQEVN